VDLFSLSISGCLRLSRRFFRLLGNAAQHSPKYELV
jgi:hypothetical protein